jgi:hypothetical protein
METMKYFARPETPAAGSPVGALVIRIMDKNPGMGFEEARSLANIMLDKAAGRKVYTVPRVYSPEEKKARQAQFREFSTLRMAA